MPTNAQPQKSEKNANANDGNAARGDANEGEGNYTAARHYNDATRDYVKSGRVDQAAKKAEAAVEGPEGKELREAELAARATDPGASVGDGIGDKAKKPQSAKQ
jgi:hypothetical protein